VLEVKPPRLAQWLLAGAALSTPLTPLLGSSPLAWSCGGADLRPHLGQVSGWLAHGSALEAKMNSKPAKLD
jgi:hypothetical protein